LPDTIISVSNHTTAQLRTTLGANCRIITAPNGLDITAIQNTPPSPVTSDIIFAGRLLSHKHIDTLLHAVAILKAKKPGIKAIIVGEGPEKENLKKLAHDLALDANVSFMDFFENHKNLYSLMHSSKVFALPSTREGFGLTAIEADACGLPVVTVDHPHNAAKDLVSINGNGFLSSLDEHDLAVTLEAALARKEIFNNHPSYAERYDWSHIIPEITKAYAII